MDAGRAEGQEGDEVVLAEWAAKKDNVDAMAAEDYVQSGV